VSRDISAMPQIVVSLDVDWKITPIFLEARFFFFPDAKDNSIRH